MDKPAAVIRDLEELSLNAWPGLKTVCLDGWLLRFADRYTRRANSVNPLYPSRHSSDLLEKIAYCETLYARTLGQDVVFKMTDAAEPGHLDGVLAARGYCREADTSVLTRHMGDSSAPDVSGRQLLVSLHPSEEWLAACCELANVQVHYRPVLMQMLDNIVSPSTAFALLRSGNSTAAVGMAVVERGHMGLFDINTAPQWRRKGMGTQLVGALLSWGQDQGAYRAYLQVMQDNEAALRLYAKLGFSEAYTYWYRVKTKEAI
jgi:GNAT superfamily N-acetyltransferase